MSRHGRSSSIPIPRAAASSTSPSRNIEAVISIPFSAGVGRRPRLSGTNIPQPSTLTDGISSYGARGSSSFASSPSTRPTARSLTLSTLPSRGSPRSPSTFEPRIIRADMPRGVDNPCLPSSSTSPTRIRRSSAAGIRAPSAQRRSPGRGLDLTPAPPVSFPRPAYLEHSSLRHLLQTEAPPNLPLNRKVDGSAAEAHTFLSRPHTSMSPPTDSDDDSNVSPPRDLASPVHHIAVASTDSLRLPTRWSEQDRHPSLSVSTDGRDLTYHGSPSNGDKDAAAARTSYPVPAACGIYYYEVEIVSKGTKGHISIGFAGHEVRLSRLPGWEKNSWGYHGDDGFSFAAERHGTPYGPTFGTGDVIGCGVDFSQNKAFYTKNGSFLGMVFDNVGKDTDIYPSVGLRHPGEAVRVNFGHDSFKYDIEYHVQQQRNQTWAKILDTPLKPGALGLETRARPDSSTEESEEFLKSPINKLVLEYLAHHGYAKTARAFETQCERRDVLAGGESLATAAAAMSIPVPVPSPSSVSVPPPTLRSEDQDMDMDGIPTTAPPAPPEEVEGDIELRTRVVNAIVAGDIDAALSETKTHHAAVLVEEDGLMLFKLRCRKFVELILEASELKKRMRREEADTPVEEEDEEDLDGGADMEVDDDASPFTNGYSNGTAAIPIRAKRKQSISSLGTSGWTPGAASAQYENALNKAINYGQTLQTDYKADGRPEVRAIFKRTFGIVAYVDPMDAGDDVAEIVGQEARVKLANEMNQAILKSQGRPTHPALERLYRQTGACILQLGLLGVGAAAFADMPKEFLDA